jgi:clan AA aspartic protease
MTGQVDSSGRALVLLAVRSIAAAPRRELTVWIDTAFTGDLVVPHETIKNLGLPESAAISAGLADGSEVVLETYTCIIDWFGEDRQVEVIGNEGRFPLLGAGLLQEHRLEINYRLRTLALD